MEMLTRDRTLDKATCISQYVNTLAKGINPYILLSVVGKIIGQTDPYALAWPPIYKKDTLNSKLLNSALILTLSHMLAGRN